MRIVDANDHAPTFVTPSGAFFYSATVHENNAAGSAVLNIEAYDADSYANGEVLYSIDPNNAYFQIDPDWDLRPDFKNICLCNQTYQYARRFYPTVTWTHQRNSSVGGSCNRLLRLSRGPRACSPSGVGTRGGGALKVARACTGSLVRKSSAEWRVSLCFV